MKKLRNILLLSFSWFFIMTNKAKAQDSGIDWQIGLGTGYTNYYGDLSPYQIKKWKDWKNVYQFFYYNPNYHSSLSYHLNLEKRLSPGLGLKIQGNYGEISMSDRYIKPNGNYDRSVSNWDRSLNFKTTLYDLGFALVLHSDNGKILNRKAFLAPYIQAGFGMTYFKNYGDLYDEYGMPYNYNNPNVETNGKFETNLRDLKTETDEKYNNLIPYIDLALGLKFRLGNHISLFLETDIKYAFSDYLDDVSGLYKTNYDSPEQAYAANPSMKPIAIDDKRGNNDGVNDFYIFNKIGLNIHLGKKTASFKSGPIYHNIQDNQDLYTYYEYENVEKIDEVIEEEEFVEVEEFNQSAIIENEENERTWKEAVDVKINAQNKEIDNLFYELAQLQEKVNFLEKNSGKNYDSIRAADLKESIKILEKERNLRLEKEYLNATDSTDIIYFDKILLSLKKQLVEYENGNKIDYSSKNIPDSEYIHYSTSPEDQDGEKEKVYSTIHYSTDSSILENLNTDSLIQQELIAVLKKIEDDQNQILKKDSLDLIDSLKLEELEVQSIAIKKALTGVSESKSKDLKNNRIFYYTIPADTHKMYEAQVDTFYLPEEKTKSSKNDEVKRTFSFQPIDTISESILKDSIFRVKNLKKEEQRALNIQQKEINAELDSIEKNQFEKQQKEHAIQTEEKYLNELQLKIDSLELAQKDLEKKHEEEKKGFFNRFKKKSIEETQAEEDREMQYSLNNAQLEQYKQDYENIENKLEALRLENENLKNTLIQNKSQLDSQLLNLERLLNKNSKINTSVQPSLNPIVITGSGSESNSVNTELTKELEDLRKRLELLENIEYQEEVIENEDISTADSIQENATWDEKEMEQQTKEKLDENMEESTKEKENLEEIDRVQIDKTAKIEEIVESEERLNLTEIKEKESNLEEDKSLDEEPSSKGEIQKPIEKWDVYFDLGSTQLSEEEQLKLKEIADFIKGKENTYIELKGFTDASGSKEVNERIATQRYLNVKTVLMERYGISAKRIQINGINISNKVSENPALDRRVEIRIIFN